MEPDEPDKPDAVDEPGDDDEQDDRPRRRRKRRGERGDKEEGTIDHRIDHRIDNRIDNRIDDNKRERDDTGEGDVADEPGDFDAEGPTEAASAETGHDPVALLEIWHQRRQALEAGNEAGAKEQLSKLLDAKSAAGWPNLFALGDALARESRRSLMAGKVGVAVELAIAATELAPDRPAPQLAVAHALWANGGAIRGSMAALARAFTFGWREPPQRRARLGNLTLVMLVALLVASTVFSVVVLYRHARIMVHDVHHLFPIGATRLQTGLLGLAVLLAPVFFRLGIAWAILWWVTLMGMYYQRRERAGAILVLALLAGTPIVLPWATSHIGYPGSRFEDIYLAARDVGALDAAERIAERPKPLPEEVFILGLRAYWSCDLDCAADLLEQAIRAGASDPELFTELGNVRFALEDYPSALKYYEMAVGKDPSYVEAQFNLSRTYSAMANIRKSGEAYRRATEIDYERVEVFKEAAKRRGPHYVVQPGAPVRVLSLSKKIDVRHDWAVSHLWRLFGGRAPPLVFTAVALSALVLMVLMGWLARIARPSNGCPRCGRAACLRCNRELKDQKQCGQCYHAFVAREGVDPHTRIRKEIEVHRYQARTTRIRRVLSLMIAGTGQLLHGSSLRGLLFLSAFVASVLGLLMALGLIPEPVPTLAGVPWISVATTALLVVLFYGLGLWDVQRGERR